MFPYSFLFIFSSCSSGLCLSISLKQKILDKTIIQCNLHVCHPKILQLTPILEISNASTQLFTPQMVH